MRHKHVDHRGRQVSAQIRTSASPEEVYNAWADAEQIVNWFPDRAEGEARESGTVKWYWDDWDLEWAYHVLSAVPGEHLVLSGDTNYGLPNSFANVLEVTIRKADGDTVVEVVNSGFQEGAHWDDEFSGVESGWSMVLADMKNYLERQAGKTRRQFIVMKPASFDYQEVMALYTTVEGLGRWLGKADGPIVMAERYRLEFEDGGTASGEVLMVTKREILLEWKEQQGTFSLKAFKGGEGRMVALQSYFYGDTDITRQKAKAEAALERLCAVLEKIRRS